MRVYELAKEKGLSSKEVLEILKGGGFDIGNHMSVLRDDAVVFLQSFIDKKTLKPSGAPEKQPEPVVPPSNEPSVPASKPQSSFVEPLERLEKTTQSPEIIVSQDMLLYEVADLMGKNAGELVLALMKEGLVCNRNHVLTKDMILSLAMQFGITVAEEKPSIVTASKRASSKEGTSRWPVVVVMGHVDHGKTTLLDFIRKTSVAAREKGGITQHIGAYEVDSSHGKLIFLDTPGHAAFSQMRKRGTSVTDIVVLVVAADDGLMPQTLEAIKCAKEAGAPIIVAINKIDKVEQTAIETVKRQLAEQDLVPEDWGGQTICVPISAQTGKGVGELLEMLVLQAEMMELKANRDLPARAFVLESNMEKGHGPVSTIICSEGTIKLGDYFLCGKTKGRVRLLIDSLGQRIKEAGPSVPVKVVGFDEIAFSGDLLEVVPYDNFLKKKSFVKRGRRIAVGENIINFVVKGDAYGSAEAVSSSIKSLVRQSGGDIQDCNIVSLGIGDVSEGDVFLARDTRSFIVAMNVRVEKNAALLAKEGGVKILEHGIIYRLLEDVEKILKAKEKPKMISKKVGEAVLLKIFDIKGVGVIAGGRVKSGIFTRNGIAVCIRDGKEIGRAKITSLQRKNKTVKEIHIDTEFAFVSKDFQNWQVDDVVHCVVEAAEEA